MAQLPGRRARPLICALLGLAAAALAAGPAAAEDVDLVGTWHVLVHYTDDNTHNPEAMRWDDRVWVFAKKGSRLVWTEYPIVVFSDKRGRFGRVGGNPRSRIIHAWEPNDSQAAQIRNGLEVNPRGSKSKTLRTDRAGGWKSRSRASAGSASIITYTENWKIEAGDAGPVFRREDMLGSGRTEDVEGVTLYTTASVDPGGSVLRGSFERDGTRHGTFRMLRAGSVEDVKGSGKTQGERVRDAFMNSAEGRAIAREEIREEVDAYLRQQGLDPAEHAEEAERMTREIETQMFDEGKSRTDVMRMLRSGALTPRVAPTP